MLILGSHVGLAGPDMLLGSVKEAIKYKANTFMFYTGAPQNTLRKAISEFKVNEAKELMKEHNIDINNLIVHAPYIINLANPDLEKGEFASRFLKTEILRVEEIGCKYLVLHPGSHVGSGTTEGLNLIVNRLNNILSELTTNVVILIETMAGKGSEVGINIDEVKFIIDNVNKKENIGVCLDTCHLNDSGVDLTHFDEYLNEFNSKIGLNYIKCIHINDSKNEKGAHKDRHENFGFGTIGFDTLINIVYHPKLEGIPKILETPYVGKNAPYKEEFEMIRNKEFDPNLIDKIKGEVYE